MLRDTMKTASTPITGLLSFLFGIAFIALIPLLLAGLFTVDSETFNRVLLADLRALLLCAAGGTVVWFIFVRPLQSKSAADSDALDLAEDRFKRLSQQISTVEEALRISEDKYKLVVENAHEAIFVVQNDVLKFSNRRAEQISGYSNDELAKTRFIDLVVPQDRESVLEKGRRFVNGDEQSESFKPRLRTRSGEELWVEINSVKIRWEGRPATLNFARDVTRQQNLESRFLQAQKMEAVGALAAGVAHDFNNLLTVISGNATMVDGELHDSHPSREFVREISSASRSAASLTRQLLAFSRKQVLKPELLDINTLLSDLGRMLERLLGEDIKLLQSQSQDIGLVNVDPGQLEQVVLNLAVNARDAMPRGGELKLETSSVYVDADYVRSHPGFVPGEYVLLSIADTGVGIDQKNQAHVFEPFFTTKEDGKGTGLGLATVYGIVKQSGGYVELNSELDTGTTFDIYLPKAKDANAKETDEAPKRADCEGSETILLVEDAQPVRLIARRALQSRGYTVLEAGGGEEALLLSEQFTGTIHLLLADVVMPGMSGKEVATRLACLRPETKILFMSGYTDDAIVHHGVLDKGMMLLEKPFTPSHLADVVRQVLDADEDELQARRRLKTQEGDSTTPTRKLA